MLQSRMWLQKRFFFRKNNSRIANVLGWCGYIKSWVWLYSAKPLSLSEPCLSAIMFISHHAHLPSAIMHITYQQSYLSGLSLPLRIMPFGHHANQPVCKSAIVHIAYQQSLLSAHTPSQPLRIITIIHHVYQQSYPSAIMPISHQDLSSAI